MRERKRDTRTGYLLTNGFVYFLDAMPKRDWQAGKPAVDVFVAIDVPDASSEAQACFSKLESTSAEIHALQRMHGRSSGA